MSSAEAASIFLDACEEAHYHPTARGIWGRLIDAHERRGLAFDAEELAAAALSLAFAPRDPLTEYFRPCIRVRHGLLCDGTKECNCDIPF
jgi:hypothetical protein